MTTSTEATRARDALGIPTGGSSKTSAKDQTIAARTHELDLMVPQFQRALPTGVEAQQLLRDAITALRQSDDLWKCTKESFFGALMTAGQLGLRVGVLGHGWVIPFENRKKGREQGRDVFEASWVLGYQGMIELAYRTGQVLTISGHAIHANEEWEITYGSREEILHKPLMNGVRGEEIIYYTQAWFANGGYSFKAMGRDEIEDVRKGIRGSDRWDSPWKTNLRAMSLKTCLRRQFTFMPKTAALQLALTTDSVTTNLVEGHLVQVPVDDTAEPAVVEPETARKTVTVEPAPVVVADGAARRRQADSATRRALLKGVTDRFGGRAAAVLVQHILKGEAVEIDYVDRKSVV